MIGQWISPVTKNRRLVAVVLGRASAAFYAAVAVADEAFSGRGHLRDVGGQYKSDTNLTCLSRFFVTTCCRLADIRSTRGHPAVNPIGSSTTCASCLISQSKRSVSVILCPRSGWLRWSGSKKFHRWLSPTRRTFTSIRQRLPQLGVIVLCGFTRRKYSRQFFVTA